MKWFPREQRTIALAMRALVQLQYGIFSVALALSKFPKVSDSAAQRLNIKNRVKYRALRYRSFIVTKVREVVVPDG